MVQRGDITAQRLLGYLDSIDDLIIQTEAVDATSSDAMAALVDGIPKSIGGCMLLSVVLHDRPFTSMTAEGFEKPFPAKITAFEVVNKVVDIASLDFFITFSSVSGLFGNAGQTNYAG